MFQKTFVVGIVALVLLVVCFPGTYPVGVVVVGAFLLLIFGGAALRLLVVCFPGTYLVGRVASVDALLSGVVVLALPVSGVVVLAADGELAAALASGPAV